MKKELEVEIRNITNKVYRLLHRTEKISDVAQRERVRSHLTKAYEQLAEAHLKLQSYASCRGDASAVRETNNEGPQRSATR
jgi:hypothetical protein